MANKSILILGRGFIGQRLAAELGCAVSKRQISTIADFEKEIKKYQPKIVINCIGSTGITNVDDCELDKDGSLFANTFLPIILAEVCLRHKIKLVHMSSGCIYHYDYANDLPISEEKAPDSFDLFYSRSKIYAERALEVLSHKFGVLILRIRIPLDDRPHPRNILNKLIKYKKAIDIPNSVTYLPDFIRALEHLIKIDAWGIYNLVNSGGLRYPELLDLYKKYVPEFQYKTISYLQLGLVRTNLLLSTKKLENTGFKVRPINEVLEECVKNYLKY